MHTQSYFLFALIFGCGEKPTVSEPSGEDTSISDTSNPTFDIDGDGDSWTEGDGDCNDLDASIFLGSSQDYVMKLMTIVTALLTKDLAIQMKMESQIVWMLKTVMVWITMEMEPSMKDLEIQMEMA